MAAIYTPPFKILPLKCTAYGSLILQVTLASVLFFKSNWQIFFSMSQQVVAFYSRIHMQLLLHPGHSVSFSHIPSAAAPFPHVTQAVIFCSLCHTSPVLRICHTSSFSLYLNYVTPTVLCNPYHIHQQLLSVAHVTASSLSLCWILSCFLPHVRPAAPFLPNLLYTH